MEKEKTAQEILDETEYTEQEQTDLNITKILRNLKC